MKEEKPTFKSGDKVRIKGEGAIQYGEVIGTLTIKVDSGLREMVWVKLADGKVEGISPRKLEKVIALPKRGAA
jgi:hypothetical protein